MLKVLLCQKTRNKIHDKLIIMSENSRMEITKTMLKKAEIRRKILPIEEDFTMD